MIFINNKYTTIYMNIIDRAKTRQLSEYSEEHHVVPKSLGGSNECYNLVRLTAREHFICHLLLVKMVNGDSKKKMSYALWLMCNLKNQNQAARYIPNSNTYERVRKSHSIVVAKALKGIKKTYKSFAGKKHTMETIQVQSKAKLGAKNPNFRVVQKPEWNKKKSDAQRGIKKPLIICEVCNTEVGGHGNYKRWHGPKCRLNKIS